MRQIRQSKVNLETESFQGEYYQTSLVTAYYSVCNLMSILRFKYLSLRPSVLLDLTTGDTGSVSFQPQHPISSAFVLPEGLAKPVSGDWNRAVHPYCFSHVMHLQRGST